jgi:4-diphosphocytidyl-2-C-methyl-D-erythritol kinase
MNRKIKDMTASNQFSKSGNGLLVRAPGKVNLSLLVKGKRADGYHDIESIMAKIEWYDEILIENKYEIRNTKYETQPEIRNTKSETNIELICKGLYKVPEGEENLVYKAAKVVLEARTDDPASSKDFDVASREGIRITLTKNMPGGSGLGSGSSDAAATLMGVNKFLKLGLSKGNLSELAAKLGSDVAFFLDGPTAMCTGRGEKIKKLERCEFRVFLIVPDVSVSTKRVYENYRHDEVRFKQLHKQISEYIVKKRIDLVCGMCANMLTESCFELHPRLKEIKARMESLGIGPVCLSGSGSSMFCVIDKDNEEEVRRHKSRLEREYGCKGIIININSW